jgi:hypothetical protein
MIIKSGFSQLTEGKNIITRDPLYIKLSVSPIISYTMNKDLETVQKLIDTFKIERIIYIALTSVCAITLLGISVFMLVAGKIRIEYFISMFVPSGVITLCVYRILKMWDDALKFLNRKQ